MFAILRARFAHSKKWISHFGICLLAGAGLVAALAPAGAAASARQAAPTARPFFFRRRELYDPLLPRLMTYFHQNLGGFNGLAGPGTRQSRKFRGIHVAGAGGSVSEAMQAVSRRRI
jgi:hypothetical protein